MAEKPTPKGNGGDKPLIIFEYIKSQHFRVIHADGAIGGVTPPGNIHMAIYSERAAIPRRMAHQLDAKTGLGPPVPSETVSREGVIREMDVDVVMSLQAAESMVVWLQQKIEELKKLQADSRTQQGGKS